jgi:leucyl aminopeptidase (aminopeptidase T)
MISLEDGCRRILSHNLELDEREKLLIVYDDNKARIARIMEDAAKKITKNVELIKTDITKVHGQEPNREVAKAMLDADVIVIVTTYSLSHTKARRDASATGARIASMPGITEETIMRTMEADYNNIRDFTIEINRFIDEGKKILIKTDVGTNLEFSIDGRKAMKPGGILNFSGAFGNLPSGESAVAPVEGTANGILIITGSVLGSLVDEPIFVTIKDGLAKEFKGGKSAEMLKKALQDVARYDKDKPYNIAELGIGTNPYAKVTGNTLEDEKVYRTAHIAFGNNLTFGGSVDTPIHIDAVFYKPDIYVDGKIIIRDGEFLYSKFE